MYISAVVVYLVYTWYTEKSVRSGYMLLLLPPAHITPYPYAGCTNSILGAHPDEGLHDVGRPRLFPVGNDSRPLVVMLVERGLNSKRGLLLRAGRGYRAAQQQHHKRYSQQHRRTGRLRRASAPGPWLSSSHPGHHRLLQRQQQ